MPLRHILFTGAEVERIWQSASLIWAVDEVRRLAEALREEVRFAHHRVDRTPAWPEARPMFVSGDRLAQAALHVATFRPRPAQGSPGPVPAGYQRVGAWDGSVLYEHHGDQALCYALEWESPDSNLHLGPRP